MIVLVYPTIVKCKSCTYACSSSFTHLWSN